MTYGSVSARRGSDMSEKVCTGGGQREEGQEAAWRDGLSERAVRAPACARRPRAASGEPPRGHRERRVDAAGVQLGGADATASGGRPRGKYDQLWQLSMADPHTGLANQLLLLDRLTQTLPAAAATGARWSCATSAWTTWTRSTSTSGTRPGTPCCARVSRRLTAVLRAEDTVGRVGGSELVVVLAVTDEQAVGPLHAQAAAHARRAGGGRRHGGPPPRLPGGCGRRGLRVSRGCAGPGRALHPGRAGVDPSGWRTSCGAPDALGPGRRRPIGSIGSSGKQDIGSIGPTQFRENYEQCRCTASCSRACVRTWTPCRCRFTR